LHRLVAINKQWTLSQARCLQLSFSCWSNWVLYKRSLSWWFQDSFVSGCWKVHLFAVGNDCFMYLYKQCRSISWLGHPLESWVSQLALLFCFFFPERKRDIMEIFSVNFLSTTSLESYCWGMVWALGLLCTWTLYISMPRWHAKWGHVALLLSVVPRKATWGFGKKSCDVPSYVIILNYDFYLKEPQVVGCHFHVSGCHKLEKTKAGACMIQFINIDSDLRSVNNLDCFVSFVLLLAAAC